MCSIGCRHDHRCNYVLQRFKFSCHQIRSYQTGKFNGLNSSNLKSAAAQIKGFGGKGIDMNDSFEDYYEYLQVSPNADSETIEKVYRLLAKRYHPDNKDTGKAEKFQSLTKAYKTLSDAAKRAAYDANYEEARGRQWKAISEASCSKGFDGDAHIRRLILSVLCVKRRESPSEAAIGSWHLEKTVGWPESTLEFHIWYLKEKGWIERSENGGFAITADGVDIIEAEGFMYRKDRLLPDSRQQSGETGENQLIEARISNTVEPTIEDREP
jgi:curved DNA-binding protein